MPVLSEPKASLSTRLAERLPEILIEAASVVFALLLALALNQWNERRELRERGAAVRAAIRAELSENRLEIDSARPHLAEIRRQLRDAIDGKAAAAHELTVDLGVSLLSAAAWRAALATQATQTIDFKWMTNVAKTMTAGAASAVISRRATHCEPRRERLAGPDGDSVGALSPSVE